MQSTPSSSECPPEPDYEGFARALAAKLEGTANAQDVSDLAKQFGVDLALLLSGRLEENDDD